MKLKQKIGVGALALLLALTAGGCAQYPDPVVEATPTPTVTAQPEVPAGPFQIGVLQWLDDPTWDVVREACTARLTEWGFPADKLTVESLSAGGSADNARQICTGWAGKEYGLILALGAPAGQAAVQAAGGVTKALVVTVGGSAQDLGIAHPDSPEGQTTGVVAASGTLAQLDLIQAAVPGLKTLGVLTREGGPLDASALTALKENCAARKIDLKEATLPQAGGDAAAVAAELAGQVQAVLTPEGGLTAAQAEAVGQTLLAAKKPWVAGAEPLVEKGALAAVAVSPWEMGRAAADMAVELAMGKQLSQVGVKTLSRPETVLNQAVMETLHIQLPQETLDAAVFESALPSAPQPTPTPEPTPAPEEESAQSEENWDEAYDDGEYYDDE